MKRQTRRVPPTRMKLYSYIIVHDDGFAPNPFWGYCTLACCKPKIRQNASQGDWIAGINPKVAGNRLVYAMRVTEPPMNFAQYYNDPRFESKKPSRDKRGRVHFLGDNIYELSGDGYRQLHSVHSNPDGTENPELKAADLSGERVLISDRFYYFGAKAKLLPDRLRELITGRGYKCNFSEGTEEYFIKWISSFKHGINGRPTNWSGMDKSYEDHIVGCS